MLWLHYWHHHSAVDIGSDSPDGLSVWRVHVEREGEFAGVQLSQGAGKEKLWNCKLMGRMSSSMMICVP